MIKRQNLFSTPVWQTELYNANDLNPELLSIAPAFNAGTDYFDIDHSAVRELKESVLSVVRNIADDCGFGEFTISGRQNPMAPGKNNSPHHHPDCLFAVVYYVAVPPDSGDILLHDPRGSILWQDPAARTDVDWQSYRPYHKITPCPGTLLVFPGYLVHSVESNLSNHMRLSIAISTHFKM